MIRSERNDYWKRFLPTSPYVVWSTTLPEVMGSVWYMVDIAPSLQIQLNSTTPEDKDSVSFHSFLNWPTENLSSILFDDAKEPPSA